MFLSEVIQAAVATVEPGFTVIGAARHMVERSVGTLVIVDPESRPIGIITDRDLVALIAEGVDPTQATIGCFAGQQLQTASLVDDIRDVTEKMHKHGVRRLPVVDSEGLLAGIVALDDVLVLLGREMSNVAGLIENEIQHERVMSAIRASRRES